MSKTEPAPTPPMSPSQAGATPSASATTDTAILIAGLEGQGEVASSDDPLIVRSRQVRLKLELLTSARAGQTLKAQLFGDVAYDILLLRKERTGSGGISWSGHVVGVEGSQVTLVIGNGQMAGNIILPDAHYQIRYLADDIHVVHQIDPSAFPPEDEPPSSG